MGMLRLSPAEFYDLTPWEFRLTQRGYDKARIEEWRRTRWQTSIIVALVAGNKAPTQEKLLPLPGDNDAQEKENVIEMTADQAISFFANAFGATKAQKKP